MEMIVDALDEQRRVSAAFLRSVRWRRQSSERFTADPHIRDGSPDKNRAVSNARQLKLVDTLNSAGGANQKSFEFCRRLHGVLSAHPA